MQIFNGPRDAPIEKIEIKVKKQIGSGGSATVNQVRIAGMRGEHVDKMCRIYNNLELARLKTSQLYGEFCIAKDLCHPNIVSYKYFVRTFDPVNKFHDCHIIMELLEGGDMDFYLKEQGRPGHIDIVKDIGGQLISGIKYLHDSKIIHQDLKPQNVLFSTPRCDHVKLIDLGVSNKLE